MQNHPHLDSQTESDTSPSVNIVADISKEFAALWIVIVLSNSHCLRATKIIDIGIPRFVIQFLQKKNKILLIILDDYNFTPFLIFLYLFIEWLSFENLEKVLVPLALGKYLHLFELLWKLPEDGNQGLTRCYLQGNVTDVSQNPK